MLACSPSRCRAPRPARLRLLGALGSGTPILPAPPLAGTRMQEASGAGGGSQPARSVSTGLLSPRTSVMPSARGGLSRTFWPARQMDPGSGAARSGTSPLSRTRGLGMWGDTYPGTGRRAAGRGEHPRNHRPPHRAAVKQQLKVPRAASSCSASGSCQPGLVPRGWTCLLVWLGTPTSLLELLWTSRCTPPHHAWAFPGEAARCWEWGDAACPLGGLLARQRGGQVDVE